MELAGNKFTENLFKVWRLICRSAQAIKNSLSTRHQIVETSRRRALVCNDFFTS